MMPTASCFVLAIHVDDLKGSGHKPTVDKILQSLAKAFGPSKIAYQMFEHCGFQTQSGFVRHHDLSGSLCCTAPSHSKPWNDCCQHRHAIGQEANPGLPVHSWCPQLAHSDASRCGYLCCCLAESCSTCDHRPCADGQPACQALQKDTMSSHLYDPKLEGPLQILTISDAAFRRGSSAGLSTRGTFISLAEDRAVSVGGKPH
jgi:hypothetical protein